MYRVEYQKGKITETEKKSKSIIILLDYLWLSTIDDHHAKKNTQKNPYGNQKCNVGVAFTLYLNSPLPKSPLLAHISRKFIKYSAGDDTWPHISVTNDISGGDAAGEKTEEEYDRVMGATLVINRLNQQQKSTTESLKPIKKWLLYLKHVPRKWKAPQQNLVL